MGRPRGRISEPQRTPAEVIAEAEELEAATKRLRKARRDFARSEAEAAGQAAEPLEPGALLEGGFPGDDKAQKILASMKGEGSFVIERLEPNGNPVQVGQYDIALWPMAADSLIRERGGGNYVFKFRDPEGYVRGSFGRTFDPVSYPGLRKSDAAAPAPAPAAPSFTEILALMERQAAAHREELALLRADMARKDSQRETMLLEMMKSNSSPLIKSAQDFAAMSKLFERKSGIEELLEAREVLEELTGKTRESVEAEHPLVKVFRPLVAAILPQITAGAPVPAPQFTARQPLPDSTPGPGKAETRPLGLEAPPHNGGAASVLFSLEPYRLQLSAAIQGALIPEDAADLVNSKSDDRAALLNALEHGDWASLQRDAFLSQHWSWVERFKVKLMALLAAPALPPAEAGAPAAPPVKPEPSTHAP